MNEKSNRKREWVKTAAIVFLSVLLVLTFFSNTIMNYSLPEVATQYVEPGTITAKIRGTGFVESGDPYSVRLKTTGDTNATGVYEVRSVEVRKGDKVQKGDALCYLDSGENAELKALRKQWDDLVRKVELQVVEGTLSDSVLAHVRNGNIASLSTYQNQIRDKDAEIERLKNDYEEAQETLASWQDQKGGKVSTTSEKKKLDTAQAAYDEVNDVVEEAKREIAGWEKEIEENKRTIADYIDQKQTAEGELAVTEAQYNAAIQNNTILENRIKKKQDEIAGEEAKLPDLKKKLDKAQAAYDNKASDKAEDIEDKIEEWTKEAAKRKETWEDARESKDRMVADLKKEQEFVELQEAMAELRGESVDGIVTSPVSGSIIDVNVKSGEDTPGNGVLFTIQPEGKGYTMEFTVTNEQAKRLSVGDKAELVNAWRYDNVDVTLSGIKPDPHNPGQNKLLTFDIAGDVTAGQSLNVSVGQKNANYDLTVPNSAIREDNNGKFILTVETRSTPLSNRYIATRVDVEVLASDDNRSAVSAALYGYEYVITTSTAPVEAGKQVRLANN